MQREIVGMPPILPVYPVKMCVSRPVNVILTHWQNPKLRTLPYANDVAYVFITQILKQLLAMKTHRNSQVG